MENAFIFHKSHYILFEKGGVQMHVKRYSWFKTEPCQELRSSTACPVFFPLLFFFFFVNLKDFLPLKSPACPTETLYSLHVI